MQPPIAEIVCRGAWVEMVWITTRGIVARMADEEPRQEYGSLCQFEC